MLPGIINMQAPPPVYLRLGLWGFFKSGKTVTAATFPAPVLFNPAAESGYESLRHPDGSYLIQPVALGQTHQAWCQKIPGGVPISRELSEWTEILHKIAMGAPIPWADQWGNPAQRPQTLVFGGFSDVMKMLYFEGEREKVTSSGKVDTQAAWGYLLRKVTEFFHLINSLPYHIIIELGATNVVSDDPKARGAVVGYLPDIQGKSKDAIGRMCHAMIFQEKAGSLFRSWFQPTAMHRPIIRHIALTQWPQKIENLSYDHFAASFGWPPITVCDPAHPRCIPGRWPWPNSHWCAR